MSIPSPVLKVPSSFIPLSVSEKEAPPHKSCNTTKQYASGLSDSKLVKAIDPAPNPVAQVRHVTGAGMGKD